MKGIDVSSWQGRIDWDKLKNKIDFAIIRCGFGGNIPSQDDNQFVRNANECTRLNIPFGVYLYSYATSIDDAVSEAEHTLRLIKDYKLTYPVFLDVEDKSLTGLSKTTLTNIVTTYCKKMEESGYYVGIYANLYWFNTRLSSSKLDKYDKWLAQWSSEATYDKPFGLWQYSNSEKYKGIDGRVDGNKAFIDYPKVIRESGLNHLDDRNDDKDDKDNKVKLKYDIGDSLILNGTLYGDSYGNKPGKTLKNKKVVISIINDNKKASKPYNVNNGLGWVAEKDLSKVKKTSNKLKVGDSVKIVKTGKSSSSGSGKIAWGIGYKRKILKIYKNKAYPYQVGNDKGTTGFYKESALKKL